MKKTLFSLFVTGVILCAHAQVVPSTLVADFERAKSLSLDYPEAMPSDQYSYRPIKDVRTFAQQFLHVSKDTIGLVSDGTSASRIYQGQKS